MYPIPRLPSEEGGEVMDDEERKAFIHLNLWNMSPSEIACYARDARKELEAANAELKRLREDVELLLDYFDINYSFVTGLHLKRRAKEG
jgi:hypothetical protein